MKTLKPVNQKSVYHSFSELYTKIMDNESKPDRAEVAVQALAGMKRTFALEIKRAEVSNEKMRVIESKNFENEV